MSAPSVTRSVAALERRLGVLLLLRTTRSLRLTEAGQRYADDCRRILEEVEQADDAGAMARRGALSLTAPALFGELHVMPVVMDYLRAHPQVRCARCWWTASSICWTRAWTWRCASAPCRIRR